MSKTSLQTYSQSLESTIWRMLRDELLTREAYSLGYQNRDEVQKQINWWTFWVSASGQLSDNVQRPSGDGAAVLQRPLKR